MEADATPTSSSSSSGWRKVIDPASQKAYYINELTKCTTWTAPDARQTELYAEYYDEKGRPFYLNKLSREATWTKPQNFDKDCRTLGGKARTLHSLLTGLTGTSSMASKKGTDATISSTSSEKNAETTKSERVESREEMWQSYVDERTGRTYYVNNLTGESSWVKPDDAEKEEDEIWTVDLDELDTLVESYDEICDYSAKKLQDHLNAVKNIINRKRNSYHIVKTLRYIEEIALRKEQECLEVFKLPATMKLLMDLIFFPHSEAVVEKVLSICTILMAEDELKHQLTIMSRLWLFLTRSLSEDTPQKIRVAALETLNTLLGDDANLTVQIRDNAGISSLADCFRAHEVAVASSAVKVLHKLVVIDETAKKESDLDNPTVIPGVSNTDTPYWRLTQILEEVLTAEELYHLIRCGEPRVVSAALGTLRRRIAPISFPPRAAFVEGTKIEDCFAQVPGRRWAQHTVILNIVEDLAINGRMCARLFGYSGEEMREKSFMLGLRGCVVQSMPKSSFKLGVITVPTIEITFEKESIIKGREGEMATISLAFPGETGEKTKLSWLEHLKQWTKKDEREDRKEKFPLSHAAVIRQNLSVSNTLTDHTSSLIPTKNTSGDLPGSQGISQSLSRVMSKQLSRKMTEAVLKKRRGQTSPFRMSPPAAPRFQASESSLSESWDLVEHFPVLLNLPSRTAKDRIVITWEDCAEMSGNFSQTGLGLLLRLIQSQVQAALTLTSQGKGSFSSGDFTPARDAEECLHILALLSYADPTKGGLTMRLQLLESHNEALPLFKECCEMRTLPRIQTAAALLLSSLLDVSHEEIPARIGTILCADPNMLGPRVRLISLTGITTDFDEETIPEAFPRLLLHLFESQNVLVALRALDMAACMCLVGKTRSLLDVGFLSVLENRSADVAHFPGATPWQLQVLAQEVSRLQLVFKNSKSSNRYGNKVVEDMSQLVSMLKSKKELEVLEAVRALSRLASGNVPMDVSRVAKEALPLVIEIIISAKDTISTFTNGSRKELNELADQTEVEMVQRQILFHSVATICALSMHEEHVHRLLKLQCVSVLADTLFSSGSGINSKMSARKTELNENLSVTRLEVLVTLRRLLQRNRNTVAEMMLSNGGNAVKGLLEVLRTEQMNANALNRSIASFGSSKDFARDDSLVVAADSFVQLKGQQSLSRFSNNIVSENDAKYFSRECEQVVFDILALMASMSQKIRHELVALDVPVTLCQFMTFESERAEERNLEMRSDKERKKGQAPGPILARSDLSPLLEAAWCKAVGAIAELRSSGKGTTMVEAVMNHDDGVHVRTLVSMLWSHRSSVQESALQAVRAVCYDQATLQTALHACEGFLPVVTLFMREDQPKAVSEAAEHLLMRVANSDQIMVSLNLDQLVALLSAPRLPRVVEKSLSTLADKLSIGSAPFYRSCAIPDMMGKLYVATEDGAKYKNSRTDKAYRAVLATSKLYLYEETSTRTEEAAEVANASTRGIAGLNKVNTPTSASAANLGLLLRVASSATLKGSDLAELRKAASVAGVLQGGKPGSGPDPPVMSVYIPGCVLYAEEGTVQDEEKNAKISSNGSLIGREKPSFALQFRNNTDIDGSGCVVRFKTKVRDAWISKLLEMGELVRASGNLGSDHSYLGISKRDVIGPCLNSSKEHRLSWKDFSDEALVLLLASHLSSNESPELQLGAARIFSILSAHANDAERQVVFGIPLVADGLASVVLLQPTRAATSREDVFVPINTSDSAESPPGLVYSVKLKVGVAYDQLRGHLARCGDRICRLDGSMDVLLSVNNTKVGNRTLVQILERMKCDSNADREECDGQTCLCFARSFKKPNASDVEKEAGLRTVAATFAMQALDNLSSVLHPSNEKVCFAMVNSPGLIRELVRTAVPSMLLYPSKTKETKETSDSVDELVAEKIVYASRCIANLCEGAMVGEIAIDAAVETLISLSIGGQCGDGSGKDVHARDRILYERALQKFKYLCRGSQRAVLVGNFRMFASFGFASSSVRQKIAGAGILMVIDSILKVAETLMYDLKPNRIVGAGLLFDLRPSDFSYAQRRAVFNVKDLVQLAQSQLHKAVLFAVRGIAHLAFSSGDTKEEAAATRQALVDFAMPVLVRAVQRGLSMKQMRATGGCGFEIVAQVALACDGLSRHPELREEMLKCGTRRAMLAIMTERKVTSVARVQAADVVRRLGRLETLLGAVEEDEVDDFEGKTGKLVYIVPPGVPSKTTLDHLGIIFQAVRTCIEPPLKPDVPALGGAVELLAVLASVRGAPRILAMLQPVSLLCTALRVVKCDPRFEAAACATLSSLAADPNLLPQFNKLSSALLPKLVFMLRSGSDGAVRDACKILRIMADSTAKVKLQVIRAYPNQGLRLMVRLTTRAGEATLHNGGPADGAAVLSLKKNVHRERRENSTRNLVDVPSVASALSLRCPDDDVNNQTEPLLWDGGEKSDVVVSREAAALLATLTEVDGNNSSILPDLSVQELFLLCAANAPIAVSRSARALANRITAGLDPPCTSVLLPDKCGWLYRMSLKALGFRTWNKRWFVLKDDFLFEYKGNDSVQGRLLRRKIMLSGCRVVTPDIQRQSEEGSTIGIELPGYEELMVISGETNESTLLWKSILVRAIDKANYGRNRTDSEMKDDDDVSTPSSAQSSPRFQPAQLANATSLYRGIFGKKTGVLLLNTNQTEIMSDRDFTNERINQMIRLAWSSDTDVAFQAARVLAALLPHFDEDIEMQHKLAASGAMAVIRFLERDEMKSMDSGTPRTQVLEALWHFQIVLSEKECMPSKVDLESGAPSNCLLPGIRLPESKYMTDDNIDHETACSLCNTRFNDTKKASQCAYCRQATCTLCGSAPVWNNTEGGVVHVCNHCYTESSKITMPRA